MIDVASGGTTGSLTLSQFTTGGAVAAPTAARPHAGTATSSLTAGTSSTSFTLSTAPPAGPAGMKLQPRALRGSGGAATAITHATNNGGSATGQCYGHRRHRWHRQRRATLGGRRHCAKHCHRHSGTAH